MATYKEGEDQAGYWPDAKPETHKVNEHPLAVEKYENLILTFAFRSRSSLFDANL